MEGEREDDGLFLSDTSAKDGNQSLLYIHHSAWLHFPQLLLFLGKLS